MMQVKRAIGKAILHNKLQIYYEDKLPIYYEDKLPIYYENMCLC